MLRFIAIVIVTSLLCASNASYAGRFHKPAEAAQQNDQVFNGNFQQPDAFMPPSAHTSDPKPFDPCLGGSGHGGGHVSPCDCPGPHQHNHQC